MIGGTVKLEIFAPTILNPITKPITVKLSDTRTEFSDASFFDLNGDPYNVIAANLDIKSSRLTYTIIEENSGYFSNVNDATGFNGYVLTFSALGKSSGITLRTVDVIRNDLEVLKGNITTSSNKLFINVDGLPYQKGDVLALEFGFNINGSSTGDKLSGMAGRDLIRGHSGNDNLYGNAGNDILYGGAGNDKLYGGAAKDLLNGDAGMDRLYGNAGNDTLKGGSANDTLEGGAGADKLFGGGGTDSFVFKSVKESTVAAKGRDTVYDFSRSQKDKIDLRAIDADTTTQKDQALDFIGTQKFSKDAGELRYEKKNGDTFIYGDVNGDGKADFSVQVDASISLKASDFIL